MTDAPELLPCPFCGGEARHQPNGWRREDGAKIPTWVEVVCDPCDFCGPGFYTAEEAIAHWNRRADLHEAALRARVAELEAAELEMRDEILEASHPDFLFGAMDNVADMDTTLDEYAQAASRSIRAAMRVKKDDGGI